MCNAVPRLQRAIRRDLNDTTFKRVKRDFGFLPRLLKSFKGELDVELRGNRVHVYNRGNRAVEVVAAKGDTYSITLHEKFLPKKMTTFLNSRKLGWTGQEQYRTCRGIDRTLLRPALQKSHLSAVCSLIKEEGYSEELHFEQMVITDNRNPDCFIIDRQVTDTTLKRRSMDLLALKRRADGDYRFLVLELKMGNNPELSSDVAAQLSHYVEHVRKHIEGYRACYAEVYRQKQELGLLGDITDIPQTISISQDVEGAIIVAGYSEMAQVAITKLRTALPTDVRLYQYSYELRDDHLVR